MNSFSFYSFVVMFLCFSCNQPTETKKQIQNSPSTHQKAPPNHKSGERQLRPVRYQFIKDSVLHGYNDELRHYFSRYAPDTCWPGQYDSTFFREFEGMGYIGDINHNKTKDKFFVLYPISACHFPNEKNWDGEAYYFTDTTLPRLQTESYCCHPTSLFHVGDIDEDGISEVGEYFSSCSSRYKSLYVYSLKKQQWKEVGHVVYDLGYADSTKPYSAYVRKKSPGEFEMLEITDLTDKKYTGQKHWVDFKIEQ
jgi:hypothetical protein